MPKKEDEGLVIGRAHIKNWQEKLTGPGKEVRGDHTNCSCPYCGKNNTHVTDDVMVERNRATTFERPCDHCHKIIFYQARLTIAVVAKAPELPAKNQSKK